MASNYETFWEKKSFAVAGHSAKRSFPRLTYLGLKRLGRSVYPVDPSENTIEGDRAYPDLASLPEKADALILEVPKEETRDWVGKAAEAGIRDIWIHMGTQTPEALELAREMGINARSGTCAVMYVTPGLTYHSLHKWIMKAIGRF